MKKLTYSLWFIGGLIFFTGCMTAPLMREAYFNGVAPGISIFDIEKTYGEPYEIRELPNGIQEYCYIQRIELGCSAVEQTEFVFAVKEGVVVGKDCKSQGSSNFQFFH